MDVTAAAINNSLQMLQSATSTMTLRKAMGQDAQSMAAILEMAQQQPQLALPPGSMDIRV